MVIFCPIKRGSSQMIMYKCMKLNLSGQTNQEAFLSSARIVHQFLSKPCNAELLKIPIELTCALQDLLKNKLLRKVVL